MRGVSLIETLATLVLFGVVAAIALPVVSETLDQSRGRAAAFHVSARFALTRMRAVHRHANVALRFEPVGASWRLASYQDGDGDGINAADMTSGVDPLIDLAPGVEEAAGASFGFVPGCPLIDGTIVVSGMSPVRLGRSGSVIFSPAGTASSGTVYLTSRRGRIGWAVVVLGATGRTRVSRCMSWEGTWATVSR